VSARVPNEFWPHHGSLSKELREEAERALKSGERPATAIATTTLELGIDIGAVKSVAQVGAAPSVASLRQRLGRSGRRRGEPAILRCYCLEEELTALGNYVGIGAMGFVGTSLVVATHVEIAYSHTGGMPVAMHSFCLSSRRATARLHPDGRVEFRGDPQWFTDYYRREGLG